MRWLETAGAERDRRTGWLRVDPAPDALRSAARRPEIERMCGF